MYDFDDKLREGQQHEAVLDRAFALDYQVTPVTDFEQRSGRDRIFRPLAGGASFGVEYKADSVADRTNNAFIETDSVAGRTHGWAVTSQAHVLVYYVPPRHLAYWLRLDRLRAALPDWQARYPVKTAPNATYDTLGIVVPLREVATVADRTLFIPPDDKGSR